MTAQTVGQASQAQSKDLQLINWLRAQQDDLAMAAASHLKPATIVRVAQGALRRDPKLMAAAIANPQSLIHCLLDAARLGHEAGTDQYWLIPFGQEVTGIEGYKGVIERMYRAGGVSSVHAQVVRQNDVYRSMGDRTPPAHEYDEFADPEDRGPLRGVYAYAIMADGQCSQVIRMGRAVVMQHKAMSRGSDRSDSPWQKWEEPMWKKVPLSALEPYVPTSSEWLMTRARAEATAQGRPVIAPGWTPPLPSGPAPLQIAAGEVIEPDRAIAPKNASPAAAASPPSAATAPEPSPGPAGEAPDPAWERALKAAQAQFKKILGGEDRPERLALAARILRLEEGAVQSLNHLTLAELREIGSTLNRAGDREGLEALLSGGEVRGGE